MKKINRQIRLSKKKLKAIPFRKIAPNIVTMLALCSGVTSIRYAIQEDWTKSVVCIFFAALFDWFDGRVARFLKGSTKFGAELDSLSDFVSFGVAPAILLYQWSLYDLPKYGWFFSLLMAIAMSMRLARFNTMLDDEPQPEYWTHFFVGVPAPAAAALALMPLLISFDNPQIEFVRSHIFCGSLLSVVAFLMISRIPTFSTKHLRVTKTGLFILMILVALFVSSLITQPWFTLGLLTIVYALSIPYGVMIFLKEKKKYLKEQGEE